MPKAARLGDNAHCPSDSHGNICCSHSVTGPASSGSPNVFTNNRNALRISDKGVHSACCGSNTWKCAGGSKSVFINGISAVRLGDTTAHCGGTGNIISASSNVIIGG